MCKIKSRNIKDIVKINKLANEKDDDRTNMYYNLKNLKCNMIGYRTCYCDMKSSPREVEEKLIISKECYKEIFGEN